MMNQEELTKYNLGENLDQLMNLDPRGYGVCRILYTASRQYTKKPLTMHCAELLDNKLKKDDIVYLMTGFVLLPFKKAEMDGIVSTMLLARALVKAYGVKPVILCAEDNMKAAEAMTFDMGLHCYKTIEEVRQYPISLCTIPISTDPVIAKEQSDELLSKGLPAAVIAIECPGENSVGKFHNATGLDITELEPKRDYLFNKLKDAGVLNIAIGDLGNELGMGTIGNHIKQYVPYAAEGSCNCGCGEGIRARTAADHIITATVSDWGTYGLIAAIAYLRKNLDVMHTKELEEKAMNTACRNGMIDMYGWLIPAIDGFGVSMNRSLVNMMRECVSSSMDLKETCKTWFEKVIDLKFYCNVQ
jgi:hypothetical protein